MSNPAVWRRSRRIRARLATGAIAHLAGGAADLAEALTRYGVARALRARGRRRSSHRESASQAAAGEAE